MKKRAFTLIELLVVIAIIGVVAGIMVPVITRVRANGRRVACANNLRQIGVAMHLYIDDHDFKFPNKGSGSNAIPPPSWAYYIMPYIDDDNVWHCPEYKNSDPYDCWYLSYGYNYKGLCSATSIWTNGADINSVKSPSQCIMVTDSAVWLLPGETNYVIEREPATYVFHPEGRHSGGANVFFVDGHVGWYLQDFLIAQDEDWWNY